MNEVYFEDFTPIVSQNISSATKEKENVEDVIHLAQAFLSIESMTHKKLQKLCYYAKAWYLAIYDENLISEKFEAWVHGAVQPTLYQEYRCYGFASIPQVINTKKIPEEFMNFSREVYEAYGKFDGDTLERINHGELPWLNARNGLQPWESSTNEISEDVMKSFYRGLMKNE